MKENEKFLSVTGKKRVYYAPSEPVQTLQPNREKRIILKEDPADGLDFLFDGNDAEKEFFQSSEEECQETGETTGEDLGFLFDEEDPEKLFFNGLKEETLESEEMYWLLPEIAKKRKKEHPSYYERGIEDFTENDIYLAAQDICGKKDLLLVAAILYVLLEVQEGTFQDVHSLLASPGSRLTETFLELFDCHPAKRTFAFCIRGSMTENELESKAASLAEWLGDPEKLGGLKVRDYLLAEKKEGNQGGA